MSDVPIFGDLSAVPPRVGKLWFTDHHSYGSPERGMRFSYRTMFVGPQVDPGKEGLRDYVLQHTSDPAAGFLNIIATSFLYTGGDDPLPTDMASDEMGRIFLFAIDDIAEAGAEAGQSDVMMLASDALVIPSHKDDVTWLWAAFRFKNQEMEKDAHPYFMSHLAIRVDAGHVNRVRFTYPEILDPDVGYRNFLRYLYEWQTSVARVAAGGMAIGPFEVAEEEEWGEVLSDLQYVSAPDGLIVR